MEIPNVEKDVDKEIVLDEEDEIDGDDEPQQRPEKKVSHWPPRKQILSEAKIRLDLICLSKSLDLVLTM